MWNQQCLFVFAHVIDMTIQCVNKWPMRYLNYLEIFLFTRLTKTLVSVVDFSEYLISTICRHLHILHFLQNLLILGERSAKPLCWFLQMLEMKINSDQDWNKYLWRWNHSFSTLKRVLTQLALLQGQIGWLRFRGWLRDVINRRDEKQTITSAAEMMSNQSSSTS